MATEVLVPPLGQTVDLVTLVAWHNDEGETVKQGEMLFAIETDKAILDIEAPASGVLRQVTAQPGDEVQVLSAIALIAAPDEVLEENAAASAPKPTAQTHSSALALAQVGGDGQKRDRGHRIFVSPRARRLAEEHGISADESQAHRPRGGHHRAGRARLPGRTG